VVVVVVDGGRGEDMGKGRLAFTKPGESAFCTF